MSVNKVILIGNVGKDPEVKYMDGNKAVARFTLATNESYKDRNGQLVDQTEWHSIELWDDLAKLAEKYVKKGKQLYIEGKIRTNKWVDKDTNQERQTKYIRASSMTFLGGAANSEEGGYSKGSTNAGNSGANNYGSNTGANSNYYKGDSNNYGGNDVPVTPEPMPDDDLPF